MAQWHREIIPAGSLASRAPKASAPTFGASVLGAVLIWILLHCVQVYEGIARSRSLRAALVKGNWPRILFGYMSSERAVQLVYLPPHIQLKPWNLNPLSPKANQYC